MGFSRQEDWRELPFPSPGHLPDPGIEPESPASPSSQADSLLLASREAQGIPYRILNVVPRTPHRTLLFIQPMYTSLDLLIPNSQSTPQFLTFIEGNLSPERLQGSQSMELKLAESMELFLDSKSLPEIPILPIETTELYGMNWVVFSLPAPCPTDILKS